MTVYYVAPGSGSDGNAGTSFGAAWATVQKALDTVAAGDEVRCCQDAADQVNATVNVDTTAGTSGSPITFISYNATGTAQQDGFTILAVATFTGNAVLDNNGGENFYHWIGITIDADNVCNYCFDQTADTLNGWYWSRVTFKDGNAELVTIRNNLHRFDGCVIDGGTIGIRQVANRNIISISNSTFKNQSDDCLYIRFSTYQHVVGCTFIAPGGDCIAIENGKSYLQVKNCTFYNPTGDGVNADGSTYQEISITGCIFYGGVYGIDNLPAETFISNNCFYGQSVAATDLTPAVPGENNVTTDPDFVDAASEDFTLSSGSPCSAARNGGGNLGAWGNEDGGGGGGGTDSVLGVVAMAGGMQ